MVKPYKMFHIQEGIEIIPEYMNDSWMTPADFPAGEAHCWENINVTMVLGARTVDITGAWTIVDVRPRESLQELAVRLANDGNHSDHILQLLLSCDDGDASQAVWTTVAQFKMQITSQEDTSNFFTCVVDISRVDALFDNYVQVKIFVSKMVVKGVPQQRQLKGWLGRTFGIGDANKIVEEDPNKAACILIQLILLADTKGGNRQAQLGQLTVHQMARALNMNRIVSLRSLQTEVTSTNVKIDDILTNIQPITRNERGFHQALQLMKQQIANMNKQTTTLTDMNEDEESTKVNRMRKRRKTTPAGAFKSIDEDLPHGGGDAAGAED